MPWATITAKTQIIHSTEHHHFLGPHGHMSSRPLDTVVRLVHECTCALEAKEVNMLGKVWRVPNLNVEEFELDGHTYVVEGTVTRPTFIEVEGIKNKCRYIHVTAIKKEEDPQYTFRCSPDLNKGVGEIAEVLKGSDRVAMVYSKEFLRKLGVLGLWK